MTTAWTAALGLDERSFVAPDGRIELEPPKAGQAYTSTAARPVDDVTDTGDAHEVGRLGDLVVHAYARDPRVVLLDARGWAYVAHTGRVQEPEPGEWALDGRAEPAAIHLSGPDGDCVVVSDGATVEIHRLASLAPLAPPLELEAPGLDELLDGQAVEDWLVERVAPLLDASDAYARAAGVGCLARGWAPRDRQAALGRLLAGEPGLPDRARRWAASLSDEQRRGLVRIAVDQVGACEEALERLSDAASAGDDATARQELVELVERRDLLASVRWVLTRGEGGASELDQDLATLDDEVRVRWSERPHPTGLEAVQWVRELAAREPDAWWSAW